MNLKVLNVPFDNFKLKEIIYLNLFWSFGNTILIFICKGLLNFYSDSGLIIDGSNSFLALDALARVSLLSYRSVPQLQQSAIDVFFGSPNVKIFFGRVIEAGTHLE